MKAYAVLIAVILAMILVTPSPAQETPYTFTRGFPAKLFWSVTVYDSEARTIINTDQSRGAVRSMFERPEANVDGSFDIFFGPNAPAGKEKQWVKTIPGKGWFTFVRMYGPQAPLFDGTYKLQDIQASKSN